MAIKVDGKVVKAKLKAPRSTLLGDEKYTGPEPVWDTERAMNFDSDTFDHHLRRSFFYYNYHFSSKDLKKYVTEYMRTSEKFSDEEIKAFERAGDRAVNMTVSGIVMAHRQGMPMRDKHTEYVRAAIMDAISRAEPEYEIVAPEDVQVFKPTIQDRMNEKTSETIGELEGYYDEVVVGKSTFKMYEFLTAQAVPQSQLTKYEHLINCRKAELLVAQHRVDEQIAEGYRHYRASDFKRMIAFLDAGIAAIEQYRNVKKAAKKLRKPRAVSKEKLVSKLKYAKEDKILKLVSINPADILGSTELWVFNVKTRKLGKYVADAHSGTLGIKGTTIVGFDEMKSVCKTLRKPDEKLKEFAKAGKIQLRKFLEDIKATETKLNGRISADIVLLRVQ
jgi:hypothetical protein